MKWRLGAQHRSAALRFLEGVLQPEFDYSLPFDGNRCVIVRAGDHRERRRIQIRMVERVEEFRAEHDGLIFYFAEMERKIALDTRIEINLTRPVYGIPS